MNKTKKKKQMQERKGEKHQFFALEFYTQHLNESKSS